MLTFDFPVVSTQSFGPRLVALMAGYGSTTFTSQNGWWFWGAWVATISGALTGACLYYVFIFIGGESPINYAPPRRQRARLKKESGGRDLALAGKKPFRWKKGSKVWTTDFLFICIDYYLRSSSL